MLAELGTWLLQNIFTLIFGGISVFISLWAKKIWKDKEDYKKQIKDNNNKIIANTVSAELKNSLNPVTEDIAQIRRELVKINEEIIGLKQSIQAVADKEKNDMRHLLDCEKTIICKWCEEYIARGYITSDERRILNHLYSSYAALGGNGEAERDYNKTDSLPVRD